MTNVSRKVIHLLAWVRGRVNVMIDLVRHEFMTNAQEAGPARVFPFFKVLPPEIRLNIYKMAFDGSRVRAVLAMEDKPSGGKHHLVRFRHSPHFNLVRSCRKIYDEALTTYWSETVLHFSRPDENARALAETLWGAELALDSYYYHLCTSLPEVAKMNVRHIRYIRIPPLGGDFVKQNPQLTASALLGNFKKLITCDITITIGRKTFTAPSYYHDESFESDIESETERDDPHQPNTTTLRDCFGFFKMSSTSQRRKGEPKNFLREFFGVNAGAKVVFLCTSRGFVYTRRDSTEDWERTRVARFWNLSNGVFFETAVLRPRDEEGYKMAMTPASEIECS